MVARFAAGARTARSLVMVLLLAPALGACAYGVGDLFGDDPPPPPPPVFVPKSQADAGAAAPAAEAEEEFPNLAQVPERPTVPTAPAERQELAEGLAADRRNAQYTRERLTGAMSDGGSDGGSVAGGDAAVPPPPGSVDTAEASATAPPAPPAAPVTTIPDSALTDSAAADTAMPPEPAAAESAAAMPATAPSAPPPRTAAAGDPGVVPPPPSAGGATGDEAEAVRRAIDSRADITAGTGRGSEMQSRTRRPVLERTERLTAALNDPNSDTSDVDAFTRRMAERSPAARAVPPGSDGARGRVAGDDGYGGNAAEPAMPASRMPAAAATATEGPASRRADELLAARAGAELDAYTAGEPARQPQPAATTPAPVLITTTSETVAETAYPAAEPDLGPDLEAGAQSAIDRRAGAGMSGAAVTEDVAIVQEVTPAGQVTTVATETVTVVPQPLAPPRPQPQTLAEIYEAQLRAASATTLQEAAREGAQLAELPAAYRPQPVAQARGALPAAPAAAYAGQGYPPQQGYGQGTVIVSGSGASAPVQPLAPARTAALLPGYPAGAAAAYPAGGQQGLKAGTVRFAAGSSRLGSGDLATLRRVAQLYRDHGGLVQVVGHASSRTGDMPPERHKIVNFDMSLERAEAVARQLRQYGIPAEALVVEARSDMEPIYFEAMPAAEAANRRAEIYFIR